MSTRWRLVVSVGAIVLFTVGLGTLSAPRRLENVVAPPATFSPGTPGTNCDDACSAFLESISPSLATLIAEGTVLAEMANSRSRNVLELTVRMDRFRSASGSYQSILATSTIPAEISIPIAQISGELDAANQAIDDSISAIRSFDWESLSLAVETFSECIDAISEQSTLLLA